MRFFVNPIATDSFGFSDKDMSYFFIINVGAVFSFLLPGWQVQSQVHLAGNGGFKGWRKCQTFR